MRRLAGRAGGLSLRLRLTLYFALLSLATVAAALLLSRAVIAAQLHGLIDQEVASEVSEFSQSVSSASTTQDLIKASRDFVAAHIEPGLGHSTVYRISFTDGTVLINDPDPNVSKTLERMPAGQAAPATETDPRLGDLRVVATTIKLRGQVVGIFRAALPLAFVDAALGTLAGPMLIIGLVVVAGGTVVAFLFVGFGLEPIRRIVETVRAISEEDMSRRIGWQGSGDEVGKLARTVDAMIARLDAAFQRQREFFTLASHELRTPLTIAQGQLEVLQRQRSASAADLRESLEVALDEIRRVTDLVSDLVMLGRVVQGSLGQVAPVDVDDLVDEVYRKGALLGPRDWRLRASGGGEVTGDRDQLLRALLNLVANAVRYTDTGDSIEIASTYRDGESRVSVTDRGRGIAPEDLPFIFEPWFRGKQAPPGGAGLGLTIVREVARAHGGRVEVRSDAAAGTVFTIRLPARPAGHGVGQEFTPAARTV